MKLEIVAIEKVTPYDSNPRLITEDDIAKLVTVIKAQGFLDPIEVDASWEIVAGHRRRLAALKMGLARVPVIIHDTMTKDEAKAYRLANNRIGEDVKWNRELLSNEILALEHLIDSPTDMGFEDKELLKLFDLDRGLEDEGEAGAEEEAGPYIKHGEVWKIGPVSFEVYDNLNKDQLRKAEALIIKIEKLVKTSATLDGQTLKEVLAERAFAGAAA